MSTITSSISLKKQENKTNKSRVKNNNNNNNNYGGRGRNSGNSNHIRKGSLVALQCVRLPLLQLSTEFKLFFLDINSPDSRGRLCINCLPTIVSIVATKSSTQLLRKHTRTQYLFIHCIVAALMLSTQHQRCRHYHPTRNQHERPKPPYSNKHMRKGCADDGGGGDES
ncbi:hypothetical protein FF38_04303 [Lucilia cuprina]|uniref:Uncharacterized protein n=1 Tax=Lucilia cuprina TaxID=7375 RepID=A0A0L0CP47_LUCCU|nr:hypothetical protein FF38_04303 [Lucilia cuprina]